MVQPRLRVLSSLAASLLLACGDDGGSADGSTTAPSTSTAPGTGSTSAAADDSSSADPATTAPDPTASTSSASASATVTATGDESSSTGVPLEGCDDPSFIVCEDFEGAALGGYPDGWDLRPSGVWGGNTMGVADDQAVSGSQALRVASGSTGAQWLTYMGDISAFASGHWGRMRFRMSAPVPWPNGGVIHGDLFEARGMWNDSTHQVRWAVINNSQMMHNWGYNVQTSNAGEFIHETPYVYPWTEEWLCIEWHHDQAAQQATLWVDGEQLLDVTSGDDPQLPTFDDISVGWANYQAASPEFVVHIDDVVLDDERVGCD